MAYTPIQKPSAIEWGAIAAKMSNIPDRPSEANISPDYIKKLAAMGVADRAVSVRALLEAFVDSVNSGFSEADAALSVEIAAREELGGRVATAEDNIDALSDDLYGYDSSGTGEYLPTRLIAGDKIRVARDYGGEVPRVKIETDALSEDESAAVAARVVREMLPPLVADELSCENDISTVTLQLRRIGVGDQNAEALFVPLPVASPHSAGVMNAAAYRALEGAVEAIRAIEELLLVMAAAGGAYMGVVGYTTEQIAADLTLLDAAVLSGAGRDPEIGDEIKDGSQTVWVYHSAAGGGGEWITWSSPGEVSLATTVTVGGLLSSNTGDGTIMIEANGTGSTIGFDAVKGATQTNAQEIAALRQSKLDTAVYNAFANRAAGFAPAALADTVASFADEIAAKASTAYVDTKVDAAFGDMLDIIGYATAALDEILNGAGAA